MIWDHFVHALQVLLFTTSQSIGSIGGAILLLSFLFRFTLLPLKWRMAKVMAIRQQKMKKIEPQLNKIRKKYKDNPRKVLENTMALFEKEGIKQFSWLQLTGLIQLPFAMALISITKDLTNAFLWIRNIARPDVILAFIIGAISYITMLISPEMQNKETLAFIFTVITVCTMSYMTAGFALYIIVNTSFSFMEKWALVRIEKNNALSTNHRNSD